MDNNHIKCIGFCLSKLKGLDSKNYLDTSKRLDVASVYLMFFHFLKNSMFLACHTPNILAIMKMNG